MSDPTDSPLSSSPAQAPSSGRTLRRLFLTLFLRGRTSRGFRKENAPKSIGTKLALTLAIYFLMGMLAFVFLRQPVFALSVYLHAMTLVFLGMFVAASAGEVLFNKDESEILLHRPVTPRELLWAKISVLVQVSLWLAGAFNCVGLFVGIAAKGGGWLFPLAHAISTVAEALFCTGCVVVTYQLCLRWFGRERLDSLMTAAQVLVAIASVVGSQLVPQLLRRFGGKLDFGFDSWWVVLLPPAWFAGFDDAIAGRGIWVSWALAAVGGCATAVVLWLAFGKLAHDYEVGLRVLSEARAAQPRRRAQGRALRLFTRLPPLRWSLKNPVSRASFLLAAAYLIRDREVKLRIYPGIAPMLVMPIIFLFQEHGGGAFGSSGFGVAFTGCYLGLIPMLALNLLQYSQQWQAADLFRAAPMPGPSPLCDGARWAVLWILTLPALIFFGLLAWLVRNETSHLPLLIPGVIAVPVYALVANLRGAAVPLSLPTEEAKSAGRGLLMLGVMFVAMALAGVSVWSWNGGWFRWLLLAEAIVVFCLYAGIRVLLARVPWPPME
jgi:ABC-2 type transport system permease protein